METVLGLILLRFAVIAAVAVVLGLAAFAVVVALRRAGHADRARTGAAALARMAGRSLDARARSRGGPHRGFGAGLAHEAARRLDEGRGQR